MLLQLDKNSLWLTIRLPTLIDHIISCKKGGFVSLRHNQVRSLVIEVCSDLCVKPQLLQLTGENLNEKMAIRSDEARVDITARRFWVTGQLAFFDVRVFNPITKRYVEMDTSKAYQFNKKQKRQITTNAYERIRI